MTLVGDILIIVGLGIVFWYGYGVLRQFRKDQRENWEVQPDQERAQWNELWDGIETLPKGQRRAIRHCVNVLLTNGGRFAGIWEKESEPYRGNDDETGIFDKV